MNPGVPAFWPAFCLAYDVIVAGFLAWFLYKRKLDEKGPQHIAAPPKAPAS